MWTEIAAKRIALVVAHPDDETLAAGAHFRYWPDLTLIQVTDGAPRDGEDARKAGFASWREYAGARRSELDCALREGGAQHARRIEFGIPDQEAIFHIGELIERLRGALAGAEVVLTHSYEGGHPDHDACALAAAAALPDGAELWEFAGYHMKNGAICSGEFLASRGSELYIPLSGDDLAGKQRMIACFRSQLRVLAQLRDDVELFRPAPEADFSQPPHPGTLLYESWGFPLNGSRWRELADTAQAATRAAVVRRRAKAEAMRCL